MSASEHVLGRFGHHPDPAIDFEVEVECLQGRLFNAQHGIARPDSAAESVKTVSEAIEKAMQFRVGGSPETVYAKQLLRALAREAALSAEPVGDALAREVNHWLDNLPDAVRVCEGGGPENIAASFAVNVSRLAQPQRQGEAVGYVNAHTLASLKETATADGGCPHRIWNHAFQDATIPLYTQQPASQGQAPDARVATDNGHKVGLLLRDLEVGTPLYAAQPASQWQAAAVETIKRVAAQLCEDEMTGDAADLLDAMFALTQPASAAVAEGIECHKLDTPESVFFYEQDFYVLSNFSSFTLRWAGVRFDTSEAAYHHEKFPNYPEIQSAIMHAPSAHEAFKLAERNKAARRQDWDDVKLDVMRKILRAKAAQHEYVRRKLLATGSRTLIEDSWRDDFWGWGPNRDGQNWLGRLWMEVRAELLAAAPEAKEGGA